MVIRRVKGWMRVHGFPLARGKTDIVVLTEVDVQIISMPVGNMEI